MGSVGNIDINDYAENHGDIFLQPKLKNDFTDKEIKTVVDKVNEFYKEFDIDPSKHKLVYTVASDEKLDDYMATAATQNGVITLNPNSLVIREDNFDVVYHELAHLLDRAIVEQAMGKDSPNLANRIIQMAYQRAKKKNPNLTKEQAIFSISNYANVTNREALSDAIRNHFTGKRNDMSDAVVDILKRYTKQYLR